jgi:starch phosphorylase
MATLNLPAWGYGIRYTYGMFKQHISPDGRQLEAPDYWLSNGNPWEIERLDIQYSVRFYGKIHHVQVRIERTLKLI